MSVLEHQKLTIERFFDAIAAADGRYELVDGVVYAINGAAHSMTGARRGHNIIVLNIASALAPAGKTSGCSTTTADMGVRTGPRTVRFPDVMVDCGTIEPDELLAGTPSILVEVPSPSTAVFDHGEKLLEYKQLESVQVILLVEAEIVFVSAYVRTADGWAEATYESLDDAIDLPRIGMALSLRDIYDTLDIHPRPMMQIVNR
jgi:Uma2 family endonuclease